jgi:hypothetical protein
MRVKPRTKSDADADVLRPFGDQISEQTVEAERRQQQTADAEARRDERADAFARQALGQCALDRANVRDH